MMVANDYEALRVLTRDGDPDLEPKIFAVVAEDSSHDDAASRASAYGTRCLVLPTLGHDVVHGSVSGGQLAGAESLARAIHQRQR